MAQTWVLVFLLIAGPALAAADAAPMAQSMGGDVFVARGSVSVNQPVAGDLLVAGGDVDVDAAVAGDVLAVGGKLRLGADIGRSLYATAGQLSINARVARHVRAAGGQIELGPKADIGGNLSLFNGQSRLQGLVRGDVRSAGGRLLIDGEVGGDVLAFNAKVELGPHARIAGKLRYRSDEELVRDPQAQVSGGIEIIQVPPAKGAHGAAEARRDKAGHGAASAVWTLGLVAMAAVLLLTLPAFSATVAATLRQRPGASLLLGFAWLVCLPAAAIVLCITLIGVPLALLLLAVYAASVPLGYVSAGVALGDWTLQRWLPGRAGQLPMRLAASAAALLVLALLGAVPWLGAAVGWLALIAGLGALQLRLWSLPARTAA